MIARFSRRPSSDNIERLLRRHRPEPPEELVTRLSARSEPPRASRWANPLRVAFVAALGTFLLLPLAAFGQVGSAVNAGKDAVQAVTRVSKPNKVQVIERSAAAVQYAGPQEEEEEAEAEAVPEVEEEEAPPVRVKGEREEREVAPEVAEDVETLPTTGLSLWLPVIGGLGLLLGGLVLLRRGRPSDR